MNRGLAQEDEIAPGEVDILIRRIEGWRRAEQRPMTGRIQIRHCEIQVGERVHVPEFRRRKQTVHSGQFVLLPRETATDVNRVHERRARLVYRQHGAVEAGREEDSDSQCR